MTTEDETARRVRVGPLAAGPEGASLSAAPGCGAIFANTGILMWDKHETYALDWREVFDAHLDGPTVFQSIPGLAICAQVIGPGIARMPWITLAVAHRRDAWLEVHLGRPPDAPYSYRDLDILSAVIEKLVGHSRLDVLGSPLMADILLEATAVASWLTPVTTHRVGKVVDRHLNL